ncbi:dnaJ homolog subfamily C member 24-like [Patiria miniata]|uniref:Uncharacterized protein n=1 Tax=Patiria miniata TaxID=46514 RepID=A0A914AE39_PATMI|nr:dnaJ homolog subfamily C member 24-like [Patiria miniata]
MASGCLYAILGTAPEASHQELKSCYQKAILQCHPDKLPQTCSEAEQAAAMQRFHLVDTAWRTLSDDASRREYDARQKENMRKPLPLNEKVHLDDMDWQEDEEMYTYSCRCGGEYVMTDSDIEQNILIISCNTCTLSIELVMEDTLKSGRTFLQTDDVHITP